MNISSERGSMRSQSILDKICMNSCVVVKRGCACTESSPCLWFPGGVGGGGGCAGNSTKGTQA